MGIQLPGGRGVIEGAGADSIQNESFRIRQLSQENKDWRQPKWEDLRVSANSFQKAGVDDPDPVDVFGANGAIYLYAFDDASTEEVFFTIQMPHAWLEGTNIRPHVHWLPAGTSTGNVRWALEYSWANVGDVFTNPTTIYVQDAGSGTALTHQLASWAEIDGTDKSFSSMLVCRLYREGGDALDTFTGDAYLIEFDIHYLVDALGSEEDDAKYGPGKGKTRPRK